MARRSPVSMSCRAHVLILLGRVEEALDEAARALAMQTDFGGIYWVLITANIRLGQIEEAKRLAQIFKSVFPDVTLSRIRESRYRDQARIDIIINAMRDAGISET